MVTDNPFLAPIEYAADGIVLRCYRPGDGPALRKSTVTSFEHLRPWMPWAKLEYSMEEAEATARLLASKYLAGDDFALGIWRGDQLVGGSGFHIRHGPISWGTAEIGMWIHADESGSGLGTACLRMMLAWGFTAWGWSRLVWRCDTRNLASARVAEKVGLIREATMRSESVGVDGERRDMHFYAIVREDWTP